MLQPNLNMYFGIDNIGVYSPLIFKRYTDLLGNLGCVDDSTGFGLTNSDNLHKSAAILGMLNVKYLISRQDISGGSFKHLKDTADGKKIFLNDDFLPRAFIVHRAQVIKKDDEILSFLMNKRFNPAEMVVIENNSRGMPPDSTSIDRGDRVVIVQYTDRNITIKASAALDGYLVLSDCYYPGWKCYLDGHRIDILKADYILRAIHLPRGEHNIEFRYR